MSWKISGLVWELKLTHSQQSILLAMADHAEHDGSQVFPSVARISWKTGYSDRQVQRVISELRDMKILIIIKEANRYRPREYKIDVSAGVNKDPFRGDTMSPLLDEEDSTPTSMGDTLSPLVIEKDLRGDIAVSARGDIAMAGRGDIAVSPRTTKKDHELSDDWVKVLDEIGNTYYHRRRHQRNSDFSSYWLSTRGIGRAKMGEDYIVLCETEEQRAWLQDRGADLAKIKLVAVLGIRADVKFVIEEE